MFIKDPIFTQSGGLSHYGHSPLNGSALVTTCRTSAISVYQKIKNGRSDITEDIRWYEYVLALAQCYLAEKFEFLFRPEEPVSFSHRILDFYVAELQLNSNPEMARVFTYLDRGFFSVNNLYGALRYLPNDENVLKPKFNNTFLDYYWFRLLLPRMTITHELKHREYRDRTVNSSGQKKSLNTFWEVTNHAKRIYENGYSEKAGNADQTVIMTMKVAEENKLLFEEVICDLEILRDLREFRQTSLAKYDMDFLFSYLTPSLILFNFVASLLQYVRTYAFTAADESPGEGLQKRAEILAHRVAFLTVGTSLLEYQSTGDFDRSVEAMVPLAEKKKQYLDKGLKILRANVAHRSDLFASVKNMAFEVAEARGFTTAECMERLHELWTV